MIRVSHITPAPPPPAEKIRLLPHYGYVRHTADRGPGPRVMSPQKMPSWPHAIASRNWPPKNALACTQNNCTWMTVAKENSPVEGEPALAPPSPLPAASTTRRRAAREERRTRRRAAAKRTGGYKEPNEDSGSDRERRSSSSGNKVKERRRQGGRQGAAATARAAVTLLLEAA